MIWSSYILPYTTVNYVVPNFYCNQYNLKLYQLFLYFIPRSYIPSYHPSIIGLFSTQFLNKSFTNRRQIAWRSFCIDPFYYAQNPISKHISKRLAHMFLEILNFTLFQRKDGSRQQAVLCKLSLERAAGLSQWPAGEAQGVRGCSPLVKEWQEGAKIEILGNIFRHKVTSPLL